VSKHEGVDDIADGGRVAVMWNVQSVGWIQSSRIVLSRPRGLDRETFTPGLFRVGDDTNSGQLASETVLPPKTKLLRGVTNTPPQELWP
jgi:hypothetical protein